jgi:hypothetical protein
MVPKDMEIRRDRKNIFCAADAPLSNKKKISSFGRMVAEIFSFYCGKVGMHQFQFQPIPIPILGLELVGIG